jgi:hypothetical protein
VKEKRWKVNEREDENVVVKTEKDAGKENATENEKGGEKEIVEKRREERGREEKRNILQMVYEEKRKDVEKKKDGQKGR